MQFLFEQRDENFTLEKFRTSAQFSRKMRLCRTHTVLPHTHTHTHIHGVATHIHGVATHTHTQTHTHTHSKLNRVFREN